MISYILDMNVISELRKQERADPQVRKWYARVSASQLYLSVLTLGEIRSGIQRVEVSDPGQLRALTAWLEKLMTNFGDRILPITVNIADRWGRMDWTQGCSDVDGLIAASALEHHMTVVTRNQRDFDRTGAVVLNPWQAS
jgi:toxin FitB